MRNESKRVHLVVNGFIQVFDKDIALASFTQCGVTLRPHDPAEIRRACQEPNNEKRKKMRTHHARFLISE
jgi:hypothetical protein